MDKLSDAFFFYIFDQWIDENNVKKLSTCSHNLYKKLSHTRWRYIIVKKLLVNYYIGKGNKLLSKWTDGIKFTKGIIIPRIQIMEIESIENKRSIYVSLYRKNCCYITSIKTSNNQDFYLSIFGIEIIKLINDKGNLRYNSGNFELPIAIIPYSEILIKSNKPFKLKIQGLVIRGFTQEDIFKAKNVMTYDGKLLKVSGGCLYYT